MVQDSLNPNITFLGEKLWLVAWNKKCAGINTDINPWYINVFQIRWLTKGGVILTPPPADFLFVDGFWWFFFLSTPHHVYSPKHISFFFYDHYDVRYGHFSTSGVSKNHVFSSFWLTAFLLDFCPTFFWSKIDAWDNSYWNYISPC